MTGTIVRCAFRAYSPHCSKGGICRSGLMEGMQVRNPVCGMMVDPARAATKGTYGGETVYFCSESCWKTYERTHPHP